MINSSTSAVVHRNLARRIAEAALVGVVAYSEFYASREPGEEVTLEAPTSAPIVPVLYQIGWGDCIVDCTGQHFWRVEVTPTSATLVAEWGDPIPPDALDLYRRTGPSD